MTDYKDICRKAVMKYGISSQVDMAHEEMGELSVALNHFKRGRGTMDEVITEIADVAIMTYQLALIFGEAKTKAEIERKLMRLKNRMEK